MNNTKIKTKTETERLFADLDKPSLHALAYALRHPDTWPRDFVWNYNYCNQCAMGLAHGLWSRIPPTENENAASIMARQFAMPYSDAVSIFMGRGDWTNEKVVGWFGRIKTVEMSYEDITPEMVADQIDKYLATAE